MTQGTSNIVSSGTPGVGYDQEKHEYILLPGWSTCDAPGCTMTVKISEGEIYCTFHLNIREFVIGIINEMNQIR